MTEENEPVTTEQVEKHIPNPTGKGGFGDNPQNRSNGTWSAKDSISFQYKKLVRMNTADFKKWEADTPEEDMTVAQSLAYASVVRARSNRKDLQEVTDRTEGKAPQTLIHEGNGIFSQQEIKIGLSDELKHLEPEAV